MGGIREEANGWGRLGERMESSEREIQERHKIKTREKAQKGDSRDGVRIKVTEETGKG